MTQKQIGYFQVILAGVFFGFLGLFGKLAYRESILPGELLGLRFITATFIFACYILLFNRSALKLNLKTIVVSLLLGVLGYAVFSSFYFAALTKLSASLTVLLLYTYPIMVTITAGIFFNEKITGRVLLALVLSSIGLVGLVWGEWKFGSSFYLLYGLGSAFFYMIYILIFRQVLSNVNVMGSSFFVHMGAGIVLCAIYFSDFERPVSIVTQNPWLIFGMAIFCSVLPLTLFLSGLQKITSSEASILSTTEPIFGVLAAMIFLGEKMSPIQVLGGILVLGGMLIISLKKTTV